MIENDELSHKIIGCAIKVHKYVREWFSEVNLSKMSIYCFGKSEFSFEREVNQKIYDEKIEVGFYY
jgi:hypothetical protein